MRIGLISKDIELSTTSRFIAAGERRGHEMVPLRLLDGAVILGGAAAPRPALLLDGVELPPLDALIPRLGAYLPSLALSLGRCLIAAGATPLNDLDGMAVAQDKLRTAERLVAAGLPTPRTIFAKDLDHLDRAVAAVGGAPVVIKPTSGAQGRGVMLAETTATAVAILESLIVTGRDHLVQEFIATARGEDRRLLVVGDRVVAAIRRRARAGEFRPNLHRGGAAEPIVPSAEEREVALAATRAVGLRFAGVDLLAGPEGPVVVEVNGSPGLEGIEGATGLDLAGEAIVLLEELHARARSRGEDGADGR
jgi:ribosomal protein S6--L-glutamate ligase